METALRDLTAIKRDETPAALLFFPSREAASRFQALSLPALLRLYETVDGGLETLSDAGVNLRTAAAALAVRLWERKS